MSNKRIPTPATMYNADVPPKKTKGTPKTSEVPAVPPSSTPTSNIRTRNPKRTKAAPMPTESPASTPAKDRKERFAEEKKTLQLSLDESSSADSDDSEIVRLRQAVQARIVKKTAKVASKNIERATAQQNTPTPTLDHPLRDAPVPNTARDQLPVLDQRPFTSTATPNATRDQLPDLDQRPVTSTATPNAARNQLPVLEQRPTVTTVFVREPISTISLATVFTHLQVYGRVVEISAISNKPVSGGHRALWWIWIVDDTMCIQISIWAGVGTPRGDPPLIPRQGEVVLITGFSGVLSQGQWDKWHPCQLQAEQSDIRFAYPGTDASLLWDKQLNPARTIQPARTSALTAPRTPDSKAPPSPLARDLGLTPSKFCLDCGAPFPSTKFCPAVSKYCPESGKLH